MPQTIFAHLSKRRAAKNVLRTAHLPSPAPARSAVKRTGSVTTGHNPHNVLTTCTAKERDGYPQVCYPRPLFFFAPGAARFFFSSREKKKWGAHSPFPDKEKTPHPRRGRKPHPPSGGIIPFPGKGKANAPGGAALPPARGKKCAAHPATQVQRRKTNPFYNILYN